jgi:hypothetical protein
VLVLLAIRKQCANDGGLSLRTSRMVMVRPRHHQRSINNQHNKFDDTSKIYVQYPCPCLGLKSYNRTFFSGHSSVSNNRVLVYRTEYSGVRSRLSRRACCLFIGCEQLLLFVIRWPRQQRNSARQLAPAAPFDPIPRTRRCHT